MSSIVIAGDTSGSVTLQAPAVAGATTVNLPSTLGNTSTSAFATTDASGNLGLGVTPSAWLSTVKAIQYGTSGSVYSTGGDSYFNNNWYLNSSAQTVYLTTGAAQSYSQSTGQHIWYTAASGTAGNAFTFTQAMTLNASGNLVIGDTNAGARLHVVTTAPTITTMQSTAANGGYLTFSNGSTVPLYIGFGSTLATGLSTSDAALRYSNNLIFSSGASEKMRIDSSGIVTMSAYGVGTATFSSAGVISSVSDETWKIKDGVPVDTDAMLQKLEPCYWFYNEEKAPIFGADRQLGFFAQNVNAAIGPEAAPEPEEGKPWGYYDRSVLAVTVMSLQKALVTIESLKARLDAANL